jgi:lactoylglutathione lyase
MAETAGYRFNHTMIRVKDPKASLKFYCEFLGMEEYSRSLLPLTSWPSLYSHSPELVFDDFTLYFLAYNHTGRALTSEEKAETRLVREGEQHTIDGFTSL